jgi:subtilisin family serine protease
MWKKLVGMASLVLVCAAAVWAVDKEKDTTKLLVHVKPSEKLGAGLRVLEIANTKLVGVAKGGVVISVPTAQLEGVEKKLAGIKAKITRENLPKSKPANSLILSYKGDTKVTKADLLKRGYKILKTHKTPTSTVFLVEPTGGLNSEAVTSLTADPDLAHAELNRPIQLPPMKKVTAAAEKVLALKSPNDPDLSKMWGMRKTNAIDAWKKGHNAADVTVAVIDTGADPDHEDLKDNLVPGFNFITDTADATDDNGHGTHVAGTIGAVGDNGKGVVGVCWKVKIMPLKFLDQNGSGDTFDAIKAVDFATQKKVQIISNSWGGSGFSQGLSDAIGRANTAGILFVAAAGNNPGQDNDVIPQYPASYAQPNIVAVAAIDIDDNMADFSDFGKTSVHLGAPGVQIFSTMLKTGPLSDPSGYGNLSGTSMATPHVSGTAALILGRAGHSGDKAPELKKQLLDNVRKIDALDGKCTTGGTLDLSFLK